MRPENVAADEPELFKESFIFLGKEAGLIFAKEQSLALPVKLSLLATALL